MTAALKLQPSITVAVYNRYAEFIDCEPDIQAELKKHFRYQKPGHQFSLAYRMGSWDGYTNLMQRSRVGTGLFLERRAHLESCFDLTVKDLRQFPEFRKVSDPGARPYQVQALKAMISASNVGGLVLIATGGGKTRLSGAYFRCLIGKAVFVVDELTLLDQSRAEISAVLQEPVGIIGRSLFQPERITVATVQTLSKHRDDKRFKHWFSLLDVIIIDEIHVAINKRNFDVIRTVRPKAVFGLTATLQIDLPEVRLPVTALAGQVIYEYPIQDGVDEGYLTQGMVCVVEITDKLSRPTPGYWSTVPGSDEPRWIEGTTRAADYRYRISLNKARNDCIESIVREGLKRGRRIIVLVEQISHLKILSARLRDIEHRVLSGNADLSGDSSLRLSAMKEMDSDKVRLLIANRVFGKGVNVKTVNTIIDGTGLSGRDSAIQRYGRGVRKSEGKEELLYVDVSDRGNKFAGAAFMRERALRETGARVKHLKWRNNPEEVFLCSPPTE